MATCFATVMEDEIYQMNKGQVLQTCKHKIHLFGQYWKKLL